MPPARMAWVRARASFCWSGPFPADQAPSWLTVSAVCISPILPKVALFFKSTFGHTDDMQTEVLGHAARRAVAYLQAIPTRRVAPDESAVGDLQQLGGALPEEPSDPSAVID